MGFWKRSGHVWFPSGLVIGGILGLAFATLSELPENAYARARYTLRESLGLQKNWFEAPGPEAAADRQEVSCPAPAHALTIVTGGQSNAANSIPVLSAAKGQVSVWFDGRCFAAVDPILGANGLQGSLWPNLADEVASRTGRPVLLINGAIGGTQVGDWLDDRSGYYKALLDRVQSARATGYEPDLLIWHQGETDAAAERDIGRFEAKLDELSQRLLTDLPEAKFYMFRASMCMGERRANGVPAITEAQSRVVSRHERIFAGLNTDVLARDYRWDGCHFNSAGRTEIIRLILPDILHLSASQQ